MTIRYTVLGTFTLLVTAQVAAQNDGDHSITNGTGQSFLAPDAQVAGGAVAPFNMTIGDAPTTDPASKKRTIGTICGSREV